MTDFIDKINISITEYLQQERDSGIKKILDLLDLSDVEPRHKEKIRKSVLDVINGYYMASCRVLTYIQEKTDENKKK